MAKRSIRCGKGTADQMLQAFEDKLVDLGGVDSATNTANIGSVPVVSAEDDEIDLVSEYLYDLELSVHEEIYGRLGDVIDIDDVDIEEDDINNSVLITIQYYDDEGEFQIIDYSIPYDDLTLDPEFLSDDTDYIVDDIESDFV